MPNNFCFVSFMGCQFASGSVQGISYDQHLDKILYMVSKLTYFVALHSELNQNLVKWVVFFVVLIMVISNFASLIW